MSASFRVEHVGNRVEHVEKRVEHVGNRVEHVGNRVKGLIEHYSVVYCFAMPDLMLQFNIHGCKAGSAAENGLPLAWLKKLI